MADSPRRMSCPAHFLRTSISRPRYLRIALISFAVFTAAWAAAAEWAGFERILLPSPADVITALWNGFTSGELLKDIAASVWRVMAGFAAGALLSLPLGILVGSMPVAEAVMQPMTEFMRYLPVPAFLPLCILWFGIGDLEKIVVIFLGTFFQLVVLVADDARNVPAHLLDIGYTLGLGLFETMSRIVLPGAWPRIFEDLRVSFGWAWSYVVVAEIVAADKGVGFRIMQSERFLRTADMVAGVLLIGLLGLAADSCFQLLGAVLFPYDNRAS